MPALCVPRQKLGMILKLNNEIKKWERIVISICSFFLFSVVGLLVRAYIGPIPLLPISSLLTAILPMTIGFGLLASVLAYCYPKPFGIILCFIPGINGSN